MTNPITRTRTLALAALFSAAALLAGCGGGDEVTVTLPGGASATGTSGSSGTGAATGTTPRTTSNPTGPFATPTLTITGPSRAIANTRYTYQAVATNATPSNYSWNWGDGSPNTAGSSAPKVWNKNGSFVGALSASVFGTTLTGTASVAVVTPISVGNSHTCSLKTDTTVVCRGANNYGQLGNGTETNPATTETLVVVAGLTGVTAVAVGGESTCALKSDGTVACWGYNLFGKLGDGTSVNRSTSVAVTGLTNAVAISTTGTSACALKSDGSVVCWGFNGNFQLGNGMNVASSVTTAVTGLTDAVAIASGSTHSCALRSNGTVVCWGVNSGGGLGDGTTVNSSVTVAVVGLTDTVAISAGLNYSCALKSSGSMFCWGLNSHGQLGDGSTNSSSTPVAVSGLSNVIALGASGFFHNCALKSDGTVACWGRNTSGSIGDGTTIDRLTPTAVLGVTGAVAISSKHSVRTCAVKADGTEVCWGVQSNN